MSNIVQRLQKFIKRLAAADDTLEELGTLKIYRKLHIHIKRTLIGWLVCTQIANISDMIWFSHNIGSWCMIMPYITNHIQYANMFVDLIFTTCLWFVCYLKHLYILHINQSILEINNYYHKYFFRKLIFLNKSNLMANI